MFLMTMGSVMLLVKHKSPSTIKTSYRGIPAKTDRVE